MESHSLELQRLNITECFVYKLPAFVPASGHVAETWGLDKPILTGTLKMVQKDNALYIRVFSPLSGESGIEQVEKLFCECPVNLVEEGAKLSNFVDTVADSSRYFVLRVVEPTTKKHVFLGCGFRERQTAFDFKATLQDFERYIKRQTEADARHRKRDESNVEGRGVADSAREAGAAYLNTEEFADLSIKKGEKLRVSLKTGNMVLKSGERSTRAEAGETGVADSSQKANGLLTLKPPPKYMSAAAAAGKATSAASTSEQRTTPPVSPSSTQHAANTAAAAPNHSVSPPRRSSDTQRGGRGGTDDGDMQTRECATTASEKTETARSAVAKPFSAVLAERQRQLSDALARGDHASAKVLMSSFTAEDEVVAEAAAACSSGQWDDEESEEFGDFVSS